MIKYILAATLVISTSLANRWRGMAHDRIGNVIPRITVMIPIVLCGTLTLGWKLGLPLSLTSYWGISTGHGRYYTLNRLPRPKRPDNWPGWLPKSLRISRDTWAFDALALACSGCAVTFGMAMGFFLHGQVALGSLWLATGAAKTFAYEAAWRYRLSKDPILAAELLFGAILGTCCAFTIIYSY